MRRFDNDDIKGDVEERRKGRKMTKENSMYKFVEKKNI